MLIWQKFLRLQVQEATSQVTLKELFRGGGVEGREPGYIEVCKKGPVGRTSKDFCYLRKTRYLKSRNLVDFYVSEDARVWAH